MKAELSVGLRIENMATLADLALGAIFASADKQK
jgi:hypothetical protein